jgi:hypothetical protein
VLLQSFLLLVLCATPFMRMLLLEEVLLPVAAGENNTPQLCQRAHSCVSALSQMCQ